MLDESEVQTLTELGLTGRQARVFHNLLKYENATAKTIALASKLPRQDIYTVLDELQELGIVEKQINTPTKFAAVPLGECVETLLQKRNRENSEMRKKAAKMLRNLAKESEVEFAKGKESHFLLVPKGRVLKRIRQAINAAKESVDVVLTWNRFFQGFINLSESDEKALSRKVKLRIAVEKPAKDVALNQLELPTKSHFCEVKFISFPPKVILGIYDGKEVSIAENPKLELEESPLLWSDSDALISLARDYFEILWLTAKEIPPNKTKKELP
jgi:sugar-specific transcriptional regulator TrmB